MWCGGWTRDLPSADWERSGKLRISQRCASEAIQSVLKWKSPPQSGEHRFLCAYRSFLSSALPCASTHPCTQPPIETPRQKNTPTTKETSRRTLLDFASISGDHVYHYHVAPRSHFYVPQQASFPLLLKCAERCRESDRKPIWTLLPSTL